MPSSTVDGLPKQQTSKRVSCTRTNCIRGTSNRITISTHSRNYYLLYRRYRINTTCNQLILTDDVTSMMTTGPCLRMVYILVTEKLLDWTLTAAQRILLQFLGCPRKQNAFRVCLHRGTKVMEANTSAGVTQKWFFFSIHQEIQVPVPVVAPLWSCKSAVAFQTPKSPMYFQTLRNSSYGYERTIAAPILYHRLSEHETYDMWYSSGCTTLKTKYWSI